MARGGAKEECSAPNTDAVTNGQMDRDGSSDRFIVWKDKRLVSFWFHQLGPIFFSKTDNYCFF
jgi:hypothetical protein